MIQRIILSFFLLTSSLTQASQFDCSNLLTDATRASLQRIIHAEGHGVSLVSSVEAALSTYLNRKGIPELLELLRQRLPTIMAPNAGRALFNQMDLSRHALSSNLLTESPRLSQSTFSTANTESSAAETTTATLSLLENDIQSILYFALSNNDRVSLVFSNDGKIIFNTQVSSLAASKQFAQRLAELGFGTTPESSALLLGIRNLGIMLPTFFDVLLQQHRTTERTLELAQQSLSQRHGRLELDYADEHTEVRVIRGAKLKPRALRALVDGRKNYVVLKETSQHRMILLEHTLLRDGLVRGFMIDYSNAKYDHPVAFSNTLTTIEGPYAIDHLVWLVNSLTNNLASTP